MADIKTRDVTRGTIKTLERGAGSMSRVKEQAIRTKAAELIGSQDDRDQNTYAQDAFERSSASAAAYAVGAGVEIIQRNRQKPPEIANEAESVVEKVQRAAREQGVKSILGRQEKARMADAELLRNTEERRLGDRVSNGSMSRISVSLRRDAGKTVFTEAYIDKFTNELVTSAVSPFKNNGQFAGSIFVDIALKTLDDYEKELHEQRKPINKSLFEL